MRIFFLLITLAALGAPMAGAAVPVSDSMSLEEIERAMQAYPPSWEHGDERAAITASLDKHINVQITKDWTILAKRQLRPVHEFYLRRVEEGLSKLERTKVAEGVHAFKFYSSTYIFRTAQGTLAVEFSQGPINSGGEPETRDEYGSGFYWTPEQRDRVAKQVDAYIITHRHHDHSDYSLAKRMTDAGKPVICPAQLKTLWKDFADKLTVPEYGTVQKFGPAEIFTMLGMQYSRNEPSGTGTERNGVPNVEKPSSDSETVCYLFKLAGIAFITCGENHIPAVEWLQKGVELGFKPNVRLSLGQFQGDRAMSAALKTLKPVFRLPLHEYEMMHAYGGNRTGPLMQGSNRKAFDERRMMPMLWGENFLITDDLVAFTR